MSGSKKFFFFFLIVLFSFSEVKAEDPFPDIILFEHSGQIREMKGQILNFTGSEGLIVLQKEKRTPDFLPAYSIIEIHTAKCDAHKAGDRAFDEGKKKGNAESFLKAVDHYKEARKTDEKRPWMRIWITSLIVKSFRGAGRDSEAISEFLILCQIDPLTPYLDSIPLQWFVPRSFSPEKRIELEQIVLPWITAKTCPAAQLLAASYLLESGNLQYRTQAVEALESLLHIPSSDQNSPMINNIALLATAQLWRIKLLRNLSEKELPYWEEVCFRLSPPLRAGPLFLTGKAFWKIGQKEKARDLLLRIPILYTVEKNLCLEVESLISAGQK